MLQSKLFKTCSLYKYEEAYTQPPHPPPQTKQNPKPFLLTISLKQRKLDFSACSLEWPFPLSHLHMLLIGEMLLYIWREILEERTDFPPSIVICRDHRAVSHETSTKPSSEMPTIYYAVIQFKSLS